MQCTRAIIPRNLLIDLFSNSGAVKTMERGAGGGTPKDNLLNRHYVKTTKGEGVKNPQF